MDEIVTMLMPKAHTTQGILHSPAFWIAIVVILFICRARVKPVLAGVLMSVLGWLDGTAGATAPTTGAPTGVTVPLTTATPGTTDTPKLPAVQAIDGFLAGIKQFDTMLDTWQVPPELRDKIAGITTELLPYLRKVDPPGATTK